MLDNNSPLGMPAGSVRSIIALMLCLGFIYAVIIGIPINDIKEVFLIVLGFYFGLNTKSNLSR